MKNPLWVAMVAILGTASVIGAARQALVKADTNTFRDLVVRAYDRKTDIVVHYHANEWNEGLVIEVGDDFFCLANKNHYWTNCQLFSAVQNIDVDMSTVQDFR